MEIDGNDGNADDAEKTDLRGSNRASETNPFKSVFSASSACHFPTFLPIRTLYRDMRPDLPFHIKPVHTLLAAFALLAIASMLFFYSKSVSAENSHSETSEGTGSFYSPLMCI